MEKQKTKHEENKKNKFLVPTRGRTFEGIVTKKFPNRLVIEIERTVYVPKYERYYKKKSRLHARISEGIDVNVGDYVKIRECRPLSKIVHFIFIEKLRSNKKELKK